MGDGDFPSLSPRSPIATVLAMQIFSFKCSTRIQPQKRLERAAVV
jgi:hypothetical protein